MELAETQQSRRRRKAAAQLVAQDKHVRKHDENWTLAPPPKELMTNHDIQDNNNNSHATRQPSESLVKELGRKAKERLQQELRKRPGIICLDPASLPTPLVAPQGGDKTRRKSEKTASNTKKSATSLFAVEASSSVVCLSGFPQTSTTAGHVKRFLSGMDVLRIYLPLFTMEHEQQQELMQSTRKRRRAFSRKRSTSSSNSSNTLSVYVLLPSSAIASLALARDGEPAVGFDKNHQSPGNIKDQKDDESITIHVRDMSPEVLCKMQSIYINVAFLGGKGVTLQEIHKRVQAELHPAVQPILKRHLQQQLQRPTSTSTVHVPGLKDDDWVETFYDENRHEESATNSATSKARLENLVNELTYHLPWVDLTLSSGKGDDDPKAHLTLAAVNVLQSHLEHWKLQEVRQFRLNYL